MNQCRKGGKKLQRQPERGSAWIKEGSEKGKLRQRMGCDPWPQRGQRGTRLAAQPHPIGAFLPPSPRSTAGLGHQCPARCPARSLSQCPAWLGAPAGTCCSKPRLGGCVRRPCPRKGWLSARISQPFLLAGDGDLKPRVNGNLGFNLPRAGKPEHVGSVGEGSPGEHGSPQKGCAGGCSPVFHLLQPFLRLLVPRHAQHAADPGLAARTAPVPSGAAAATAKLPSPVQWHVPPHPQLVPVGTAGLYLRLTSWIVVLSSRKEWLSDRPSGYEMRSTLSCQKQRGTRRSEPWHGEPQGGETLVMA